MENTKEEKPSIGVTFMQIVSIPIGLAGLLFWLVAFLTAIDKNWGMILAFGFGFWFVMKAKREYKEKEVK